MIILEQTGIKISTPTCNFSMISNCTHPTGTLNFFKSLKSLLVLIYSKTALEIIWLPVPIKTPNVWPVKQSKKVNWILPSWPQSAAATSLDYSNVTMQSSIFTLAFFEVLFDDGLWSKWPQNKSLIKQLHDKLKPLLHHKVKRSSKTT